MGVTKIKSRNGFTLIEILIVVTILGILAAIVITATQDYVHQADQSVAKDNLRTLRNTVLLYTLQHNNIPPGYVNGELVNDAFIHQLTEKTNAQGEYESSGAEGCRFGPYLQSMPFNPYNNKEKTVLTITGDFPAEATGEQGWIYQPFSKLVKLNATGTDNQGVKYYDY